MMNVSDIWYGTEMKNEGVKHFIQAVSRGRLTKEDAQAMVEHSPRLVQCLCDGLAFGYGEVSFKRFIEMAGRGQINGGLISRVLSQ